MELTIGSMTTTIIDRLGKFLLSPGGFCFNNYKLEVLYV